MQSHWLPLVSDSFRAASIRETPNLQLFHDRTTLRVLNIGSVKGMNEAGKISMEPWESEPEAALIRDTDATYAAIKQRLAAVADELRSAAEAAGPSGKVLLALADRFEQHARGGETL